MAEGNNTPIVVAAIGALATIAVGVIANIDKFRGADASANAASSEAAADFASAATAAEEAAVAIDAAPAVAADAADAPANLAGTWKIDDQSVFRFSQDGARLTFVHTIEGAEYNGTGEISGRHIDFRYNVGDGEEQWNCKAELEPGDNVIAGTCISSSRPDFTIRLEYQA